MTAKSIRSGTHRVRPPEETWEWIRPLLPEFGITRVADITWLDEIGVPVFQAVRPNAHTLAVSQGKGISRELARVSAAMESIEVWHAEHPALTAVTRTVDDMRAGLGYPLEALVTAPRHTLGPDTRLEWYPARTVDGHRPSYVPADLLYLDTCVTGRWTSASFRGGSNGLASGNVLDEAVLHGLYEVIERDASARARRDGPAELVDPASVNDPWARLVLDRFEKAGVSVTIRHLPSPSGVPTFDAVMHSDALPVPFVGAGTHLDAGVALCRALTEAAQSRVTAIAGARDDITRLLYRQARSGPANRPGHIGLTAEGGLVDFASVVSAPLGDVRQESVEVARRVAAVTGSAPLYVDHTRPEFGIPVVHVVCPGALPDTGR
ncbi:YcaO-like family protein [Streptomyces bauhiniae]